MRDERFYHIESGSNTGTAMARSIKSLWNNGKSWTPIKSLISTGSRSPNPSQNEFLPRIPESPIEDEYQRDVVIGAKIL